MDVIKEISTEYRNIRYDAVVFCLAYCARSDDKPTKRKAYSFLNDVCRTPSHLFKVKVNTSTTSTAIFDLLSLLGPMEFSINFNTVKSGLSIIYI